MTAKSSISQPIHLCCCCHVRPSIPNSHAIPAHFFRKISRLDSGKFIVITDGKSLSRKSIDNSKAHILCAICDNDFGNKFDRNAINAINSIRAAYNAGERAVQVNDVAAVCRSLASILWRCSQSTSKVYNGFKPHSEFVARLEAEWRSDGELGCSYALAPLIDSTPSDENGFSSASLELFILAPILCGTSFGYKSRSRYGYGAIFVIGGLVVTVVAPRLSKTRERRSGYLQANGAISLNGADIWEVPFVKDFLLQAAHKELRQKK